MKKDEAQVKQKASNLTHQIQTKQEEASYHDQRTEGQWCYA